MTETHTISPAMAVMIFTMGTGILGGLANMILATRIEKTEGVDPKLLLAAVGTASLLNIILAFKLPYKEAI